MTITAAHTAYDGTITFRNARRVDIAYAGTGEAIANLLGERWYRDWLAYGSPTQRESNFLMVAPGYRPEELAIDPGPEGWVRMDRSDIEDFSLSQIDA